MIGLVWREPLLLSPIQWGTITAVSGIAIWWPSRQTSRKDDIVCAMCLMASLLWAFRGMQIGIDITTTWQQIPRLNHPGWLSELGFTNYLKLQPPLWTWWLLHAPSYPLQQIYAGSLGLIIFATFYAHAGRQAAFFLIASPLFQLMSIQPSNDWCACCALCLAVAFRRSKLISTGFICLACALKYTVYAMLPLLSFVMPLQVLFGMGFVVVYWQWALSLDMFWPHEQSKYLLHAFTFGRLGGYYVKVRNGGGNSQTMFDKFWRTFRWRWKILALPHLSGIWWYAFPIWTRPIRWLVIVGWICLMVGYGNIKYLCLLFPLMLYQYRRDERLAY